MNYRITTEAEWEDAARAKGKIVRFGTGKDVIAPEEANFDARLKDKERYSLTGVFREKTLPVKSFLANALGLYDMAGNVREWVSDQYSKNYYSNSPRNNPKGPGSGPYRVMRGGSWFSDPGYLRAASRFFFDPDSRYFLIGFRLALGAAVTSKGGSNMP